MDFPYLVYGVGDRAAQRAEAPRTGLQMPTAVHPRQRVSVTAASRRPRTSRHSPPISLAAATPISDSVAVLFDDGTVVEFAADARTAMTIDASATPAGCVALGAPHHLEVLAGATGATARIEARVPSLSDALVSAASFAIVRFDTLEAARCHTPPFGGSDAVARMAESAPSGWLAYVCP